MTLMERVDIIPSAMSSSPLTGRGIDNHRGDKSKMKCLRRADKEQSLEYSHTAGTIETPA